MNENDDTPLDFGYPIFRRFYCTNGFLICCSSASADRNMTGMCWIHEDQTNMGVGRGGVGIYHTWEVGGSHLKLFSKPATDSVGVKTQPAFAWTSVRAWPVFVCEIPISDHEIVFVWVKSCGWSACLTVKIKNQIWILVEMHIMVGLWSMFYFVHWEFHDPNWFWSLEHVLFCPLGISSSQLILRFFRVEILRPLSLPVA